MRSLIVRISFSVCTLSLLLAPERAEAAPPTKAAPATTAKPPVEVSPTRPATKTESDAAPAAEVGENTAEKDATALFELGRERMQEKDYDVACPYFEQSLQLMEGVGTKFHLANCYERQGKKAKAHTLFLQVAEVTLQTGQLDRHAEAKKRADALEVELGSLRIQVEDASTALTIRIGEQDFPVSALVDRFFVDPGEHQVIARAPKKVEWSKLVTVGASEIATVEVPELEAEKPAAKAEPEPEPEPESEPEPVSNPEPEDEDSSFGWVPPVTLGVGAVGLFAGLAFTQQYRSSNEDAKNVCPSSYACTPEEIENHEDLVEDARVARTRAYIGYGVALAGLAGGIVYYAIRPKSSSESARRGIHVGATVGADSVGGVAYGTF